MLPAAWLLNEAHDRAELDAMCALPETGWPNA
jgi:hypothetical protein